MPHMPELRVVPLERIRPHEDFDPLRVERLVGRISDEGIQVNPMMCCESADGDLVLLDGATRTESLRRVGVPHAVVQLVSPDEVRLETWHHVVRDAPDDELMALVHATDGLGLTNAPGAPRLHFETSSWLVEGHDMSVNAALSALVGTYVGTWRVGRAFETSLDSVTRAFPDWTALVEFPTLTVDDVMKAALSDDLLPAGITRFLVPERALRLNVSLDLLISQDDTETKQEKLEALLVSRVDQGRVRRYEETVVILDD